VPQKSAAASILLKNFQLKMKLSIIKDYKHNPCGDMHTSTDIYALIPKNFCNNSALRPMNIIVGTKTFT